MFTIMRYSLRELSLRWRTSLGMIAGVAIALVIFMALESITAGANVTLGPQQSNAWVVQQPGSLGEFSGSRLPAAYETTLVELGADVVVPELHTVTGTSLENAWLIRGVSPESYAKVERFTLIDGEAIASGDTRVIILGENLATIRQLTVGDTVELLNTPFTVKGVFRSGTIADSEVWMPLREAQQLFGFGDDVSVFIVQGSELLNHDIENSLPVEVSPKGESFASMLASFQSVISLLRLVSIIMAVAAVLGMLNVMFTMVHARQREIAMLRSVGFVRRDLVAYVLSQSVVIALLGYGLALALMVVVLQFLNLDITGINIIPVLTPQLAILTLVGSLLVGIVSGIYPAFIVYRLNLAETLAQ